MASARAFGSPALEAAADERHVALRTLHELINKMLKDGLVTTEFKISVEPGLAWSRIQERTMGVGKRGRRTVRE